ncbi:Major Facilitator Superfamily protein [Gemmata sp. SH-PL17]|uniref:MFS transporter n=1 Tax=Gemmata sp. SH-PL17 TaxID=1630693 RepID=UPI00078D46BE|nr:MFS transporter [Gemmata sp. SH-PL17]AMV25668.1 Major Facilitator Superfamily protein [Gemmata sp. SH-PL17]
MSSASSPGNSPGLNEKILFWASFFTLIAAGIGFSVRGFILKDWGNQFGFTQSELGSITGGGLVGFGIAIIFFSFCADQFGYGKLMMVAFTLHASSAIVTFAATPVYGMYGKEGAYWCLYIGMWLFALGNGTCEAVINPLTATLFPKNKTHWLNILHAGWPLGLILGALIVLGFKQAAPDVRWEVKLGVFLVPVLLYGLMMFNRPFPHSEAKSSGVSMGTMVVTLVSPILLFLFFLHALVGYVELGTDSWIGNITERVLADETKALIAFIWTNALMFTLRFFAGPIVEKINPIGLLFVSALMGTAGLFMLGQPFTNDIWPWMFAVTIYGLGKTFYWPTLLGTISERFPKGGALALGISGGIGMISAGMLGGPGIGYKQDYFAVEKAKEIAPATYDRYKAPNASGFPVFSNIAPDKLPPVAGLDNSKLKVFDDWGGVIDTDGKRKEGKKTTLESDLETVARLESEGKPVGAELKENLNKLKDWWEKDGRPNYTADKDKLGEARLYGAKQALLYTAVVPAALAVGFLLLILYFMATGGYKQVHLEAARPSGRPAGGADAGDWGR